MGPFDQYIKSIVSDLKATKKQKSELTDELMDHLMMLKVQYISEGFSETDAIEKAIESFGEINNLKASMKNSLFSYRNKSSFVIGIMLLLIIFFLGNRTPMPGIDLQKSSSLALMGIASITLFVPLGYWMSFLSSKVTSILRVLFLTSYIDLALVIFFSLSKIISIPITYSIVSICCSFLGSLLGYGILLLVNELAYSLVKKLKMN
ncbi:permease prefix domain 1-containing protein [Clostridium manihotivorum]|uniref:Uncharacterized protein n=1 Tax=Clostridium manihotivorum TaxID=2320868 RepID=A0A410DPM6_9CLOT|nr:permease prefix domain 1-containing protein [Clostridium manihotivorum]QAA31039.1 hypothetical protein C1I91_04830 [Clostridium manihotivorum]